MPRLANTIEAILYLKAQALSLSEIAECASVDRETAEEGLLELMADYAHRETALEVVEINGDYSLQLREDFQTLVQTMIPADIGKGALRTLAVVALKGPIIQTELINLRGSTAYQHVQELVEQGFIRKRRRSDGRSYWLQVTDKFHQYFQLNQLPGNLDQLLGQSNSSVSKAQGSKPIAINAGSDMEAEMGEAEMGEADEVITGVAPIATAIADPSVEPDSDSELEVVGSISDEILEAEEAAFQEELPQESLSA
jgi:segregation and condensation protein B